jgi:AhpC/TSA family
MSQPEPTGPRYGRYVGALGVLIAVLFVINTTLSNSHGVGGIAPGHKLAPFAVPLALGEVNGDANIATHADEGEAGKRPACVVRGAGILNVCELYEQGPVVLALFVDAGSCPQVLSEMQALVPSFPGVRFAGVALEGQRGKLRALIRARNLAIPVGFDRDGVLAALYKVVSCAQLTFAYPGGVVQSKSLLEVPAPATLRTRVSELVQAARARGYRPRLP